MYCIWNTHFPRGRGRVTELTDHIVMCMIEPLTRLSEHVMDGSPARRHLVVIDDDRDILEILSELLEETDWRMSGCRRASEAVQFIRDASPDAVLLDLRLGAGLTGWDILAELQGDPATSHIPVILFTADVPSVVDRAMFLEAQGLAVLTKPFDLDDLYDMLEAAVQTVSSTVPGA
jgi:two-component system cell cycle response regulator